MTRKNGFKIKNTSVPCVISKGAHDAAIKEMERLRAAGFAASLKSVISEAVVKHLKGGC